jgi:hypothetical protein
MSPVTDPISVGFVAARSSGVRPVPDDHSSSREPANDPYVSSPSRPVRLPGGVVDVGAAEPGTVVPAAVVVVLLF